MQEKKVYFRQRLATNCIKTPIGKVQGGFCRSLQNRGSCIKTPIGKVQGKTTRNSEDAICGSIKSPIGKVQDAIPACVYFFKSFLKVSIPQLVRCKNNKLYSCIQYSTKCISCQEKTEKNMQNLPSVSKSKTPYFPEIQPFCNFQLFHTETDGFFRRFFAVLA